MGSIYQQFKNQQNKLQSHIRFQNWNDNNELNKIHW